MNKKGVIIFLLLLALVWLGVSVYKNRANQGNEASNLDQSSTNSDKIVIVSSLFPWYDLARQIGGDYVEVSLLLPPGVEAHAFEPTPSDMIKISQSGLFIYTGDYLEPWAKDLITSLGKDAPKSLSLGAGLAVVDNELVNQTALDPHIWTDPIIYAQVAERLTAEMVKIDPSHVDYYNSRLDSYKQSLENLDSDYKKILGACRQTEFIYAGHYAFAYLAKRYNLQYEAAQGFSPDAESNPQRLIELIDLLQDYQADYVFAEELDSPQLAEALAQEAGVKILLLNSAHNVAKDDLQSGISYEEIMRTNLAQLKLGLKCQ